MTKKTSNETNFKRPLWTVVFFLFFVSILSVSAQSTLRERLEQHVFTLASDSLQGRKAGTIYALKSAEYIVRYWEEIGLDFFVDSTFMQTFGRYSQFNNVVGVIRGNDPVLRYEYIVVGAHFDHLGVCRRTGAIYSGADDNASGTAVLIELARKLAENQADLKRSIILIGFDAEEIGLIGSAYFVRTFNNVAPNGTIVLAISIDMVGWYAVNGMVGFIGTRTIQNGCALILNPLLIPDGLNVVATRFETSMFRATDTQPFAVRGIPTLHVFTGVHPYVHQPQDEAHLIDLDGMVLITEYLQNVVEFIAQDTQFASSGRVARIHRPRPLLEIGVSANVGNNFNRLTAGTFSFGAGLMTQVNFAPNWAIRPEVHFERIRGQFPDGTMATNNITIPLSLVYQTPLPKDIRRRLFRFDVSLGGYYTHRLSGTIGDEPMDFDNTFNREEWGLTLGFGMEFRPIRTRIGFTNRSSFTNLMQERNVYNVSIRNMANFLTLTYIF